MSYCPSQDWDRYCAAQDGPHPAGPEREVRSSEKRWCDACLGPIEPGTAHLYQPAISGDTGLFVGGWRSHLKGQCLPPPEDL